MTDEYATSDVRRLGNLEAERAAMARMLEMSQGVFSLSIAICNSPAQRDRIVQDVRADRPTIALVSAPYDADDLLESVRRKLDRQNPSGLFVVGIETILPSDSSSAGALRALNASRESWKKAFACPVVFWVPEYVARLLCIHAQDFWSWISHQFDFSLEPAMEPAGAVSVDAPLPVQNLTRKEKQLRIRELKERIGNVPDTASPQLKRHMSRWLMELGKLYHLQGDYDEAMSCYEESLKAKEKLGDRAGISSSLHQIGIVHQQRGDYDKALHYYEKSLQTLEELGDRAGVSKSLHNIGTIYQQRGDYDKALHYYEKSLKTAEELGDRAGVGQSQGQMGKLMIEMKRFPEALERLLTGLSILASIGSPDAQTVIDFLHTLRERWGAENFDKAWREKTGKEVPEELREQGGPGDGDADAGEGEVSADFAD